MNIQKKTDLFTDEAAPISNLPIPRDTIEMIVGYRNKALALYAEAFDAIVIADDKVKAAAAVAQRCTPGQNNYNHDHVEETTAFHNAINLPDRALYLRTARKIIDINAWAWIIERTDLERLMDHEAKKTLREQMAYVPDRVDRKTGQLITGAEIEKGMPELTVENVWATLQQFMLDADTIFRRGMANVFSKLDRRFRSHDGFKVGARMVLTYAFDSYSGSLQWGAVRDQLIDVERVFSILDGKPEASFTSALHAIEQSRSGRYGPKQSYVETDYFRIRGFKNGNAHLWFQRDDLVEKVNKLLAEYYGEVIGDGQTTEENPFDKVKTAPAKYFGFYPTPDAAASSLMSGVSLYRERGKSQRTRILEPSAGTGNLARRCFLTAAELRDRICGSEKYVCDPIVDCVEIQPHLAQGLKADRRLNRVYCQDFLSLSAKTTGLYDIVVMNPPFDRERDIDHVMHALTFLKPDGILTAVMSAGTEFRETRKSIAFRELMTKMGAAWRDLPPGSFSSVGTHINTLTLLVHKDGTSARRSYY